MSRRRFETCEVAVILWSVAAELAPAVALAAPVLFATSRFWLDPAAIQWPRCSRSLLDDFLLLSSPWLTTRSC
jgi:hypothetical protein